MVIYHSNVGNGPTYLYFSWTYPTRTCEGDTVSGFSSRIPGSNYCNEPTILLPSDIPFDIYVSCPDGFELNTTDLECIEVGGNSFRTRSEECDDGNNITDDG